MWCEWFRKISPACILLAVAFSSYGCGGGGGGGGTPPPAPSGTLRLAWDSNTDSDLDHYLVYFDTVSRRSPSEYSNQPKSVPLQSGDTTFFTLDGLVPGTEYFIRVSAVDSGGNESNLSNEVSGAAK